MDKTKVILIPCKNYDEDNTYKAIKEGIKLLGGLDSIINKDEKILLKPNLLKAATPDKAITTHPMIFNGVLKYLKENGYENISYGDSSGPSQKPIDTVKACGLKEVADKYNVNLGDFDHFVTVDYKEGKTAKKFTLCKEVVDSDAIISLSKMKTHALVNITGAIKNQYGCIYSGQKALGHAKYPNSDLFSKMIVDLNMFIKPRLYIMDGVIAMEGNGPSSGEPILMGLILISKDPVALDAIFAKLINLDLKAVPTCLIGQKYGLGTMDYNNIEVVPPDGVISIDEAYEKYGNPNFNVNRNRQSFWHIKDLLFKTKKPHHKPVVDLNKCIACGICENACPVDGKAVHSGNGKKAEYDYSKCIRCYCCQEMCPAKAISKVD